MKRVTISILVIAALGLLAAGCATIITGTTEPISVTCNVEGASVIVDGVQVGITPFYGEVPKNKKSLQVVADGYRSETVALSVTMQGWFWGNIILGGTLGSTTDFASGAAFTYAPATYQVELQEMSQSQLDYRRRLAVKKFAMIYTDEISQDLAAGEGDYLSALIQLLDTAEARQTPVQSIRDAFEASGGDQVRFGVAAVNLI